MDEPAPRATTVPRYVGRSGAAFLGRPASASAVSVAADPSGFQTADNDAGADSCCRTEPCQPRQQGEVSGAGSAGVVRCCLDVHATLRGSSPDHRFSTLR